MTKLRVKGRTLTESKNMMRAAGALIAEQLMSDGITPLEVMFGAMRYHHQRHLRAMERAEKAAALAEMASASREAAQDAGDDKRVERYTRLQSENEQRAIAERAASEASLKSAVESAVQAAPYVHGRASALTPDDSPVPPAASAVLDMSKLTESERDILRIVASERAKLIEAELVTPPALHQD